MVDNCMGQFVLLHRKMKHWEWYRDLPCKAVMIHCLLEAAWRTHHWRGKVIERGSFYTGQEVLALETGLSRQQVRRALSVLQESGELRIQPTKAGTLISVCNYDTYQVSAELDNQQRTNKQPAGQPTNNQPDNQQTTTTEEGLRRVNKGKERKSARATPAACLSIFRDGLSGAPEIDDAGMVLLTEVYERWLAYRKEDVRKPVTTHGARIDAGRCCRMVSEEQITPRELRELFERAMASPGKWQGWHFPDSVERIRRERTGQFSAAKVVDFEMQWG